MSTPLLPSSYTPYTPSHTTSYMDSDSGFMDFTQAPNARKSTIFGTSLPPSEPANSSLSSLLTSSHSPSKKTNAYGDNSSLNEPGSSSSFSLLTSRFTDDKYITPSALGYEEYKELISSGRRVEEELENVLGHNGDDEHAYGGALPEPSYKRRTPNGTTPPLSEFSPATSPSPYQNGAPSKYDYNGVNGHHTEIHDMSSDDDEVGFNELANGSHRLSENGYDSIAEFEVDDLGDSDGADEDIFVASEELERRKHKEVRDNRTNGHFGGSPLKYESGRRDEYSSDGEEVVNYPPSAKLHDFVEDRYGDEPRTVLSNGDRADYNYYDEGSKISKRSQSEDSSIPRFEDVVAPTSQIAEPTFEDASQFPDLDKAELLKQLEKDRKLNETYEDEEVNETVQLQEQEVAGNGRNEVSVSPPPTTDNDFVDVTPGTFFRARSSFDLGHISSPAAYSSSFTIPSSTPHTPATELLSSARTPTSQLAKSYVNQSPVSAHISPAAQASPNQAHSPPHSPPPSSPRHRLSTTPPRAAAHSLPANSPSTSSTHSPRLSRTLSFTSNPAPPSPSPPTSPTTPSTSTRTPPWDAARSVPTPLSESPKKEELPKKEVSVDASRSTEVSDLEQKLEARKDKKPGVWFDEDTLAAQQEDRTQTTFRNMSMMSVNVSTVPQTPLNFTPTKTQLDTPSLALLQAKFSRMFPGEDSDTSITSDYSGAVRETKQRITTVSQLEEKTRTIVEERNRTSSLGSDFDSFYNRISSTLENFRVPAINPAGSVPPTPYARPLAPPPAFTPSSTTSHNPLHADIITPEGSGLNPPTFTSPAATVAGPFSLPRSSPSPSQLTQPPHTSHSFGTTPSARLSPGPTASRLSPSPARTSSRLSPAPSETSPLQFRSSFSDLPPFYASIAKNATLTTSTLDTPSVSGQVNITSRSGSALSSYTNATATPGLTNLVSPIAPIATKDNVSSVFSIDPQYIDFGDLFQDWATDAPLTLVNKSTRTLNLAVAIIGADKESFSVSLEGQHGVSVFEIPGSSSVKLKVSYHPTLPGLHASSLQGFLLGEGGGGACFEARLRGTSAEAHGHPLVLPSSVDVGVCEVGERIARTVTITNTGDSPLFAGLSVSGREFSVRPSALTVPARGAAELALTFEPYKEKARHRAEVCVEDTVRRQRKRFPVTALAFAGDQPAAVAANFSSEYSDSFSSDDGLVTRRKNGQGKGWIGVPQGVDLGVCALACRTTKTLDVINYSSQPLTLYTSISPDIGVFSSQTSLHLAPHAKGLLRVEYISTVPGSHTAVLQLTQRGSPQKGADEIAPVVLADLHLRGETEEHKFKAQPATSIDFGVVSATTKSGRAYKQPVRIHNPGEAAIKLDCHISSPEPHYWGLSPEKDLYPSQSASPVPLDISPNSSHVLWTWFVPQKRSSSQGGSSGRRGSSGDERHREEVRDHRATLHISPHVDIGLSDSYMQLHTTKIPVHTRTGSVVVQIPKWAQPLRLVPRTPVALPIRNAGSIPLTLALSFEYNVRSTNHSQVSVSCFHTSVNSITLPVGGVEKVEVTFVPTGNTTQVATLLLRGGGILHTIQVVGQAKPNPSLLCTHPVVNFGGVQLGSETVRQFTLRNPTPHHMTLNVTMAHTDNFRYAGPRTVQLAGNADVELAVVYSPKSRLPHRAVVFFEEDFRKSSNQHPAHFQLPLLGYGGESKVVFSTSETSVSSNGTAHITARNEGNRAAFIRAACEDSGVEIAPFGVVVGAGRTQNFTIATSGPVQNTSIQFYYGDEILRKKRRECKIKLQQQLELQPKKPLTHSQYGNPIPDIFDETFIRDADYVNEDILSQLEHKEGSRRFDDYFDCEMFLEAIKHHHVMLTSSSPHSHKSRTKSPQKHTPTHNHSNDSHNRTSYSHTYVQGKRQHSPPTSTPHHVHFPESQSSSSSLIIRTVEVNFPPISGSGTSVKSCLVENPSDFVQHWKLVPLSDVIVTSLDSKTTFTGPEYDSDVFLVPTPMSWTSPHTQSKIDILFSPPKSGCTYTQVFGLLALSGLDAGTRILPDIVVRGSALYAGGSGNTSLNSNETSYDVRANNSSHNKTTDTVKHILHTPQTEPTPHTAYPRTHSPHRARTHSPPKRHHAPSYTQQQSDDSDENQRFDKYIQEITKSLPHATAVTPSSSKPHSTHFFTATKSTVVKKSDGRVSEAHQHTHIHPQSQTPASSSPTKSSHGLYIKETKLKFPSTALNTTMKEKICICNGSQEDITVEVESLSPPFFSRYKHVPIQKQSYVRLPIVFLPTEKGKFRTILRISVKQDSTPKHVLPSSAEIVVEGEA